MGSGSKQVKITQKIVYGSLPDPIAFPFELNGTPRLNDVMGYGEQDNLEIRTARRREQQRLSKTLLPIIREELWYPALNGLTLRPGDRILDVGSGMAFHLEALPRELHHRVWLLDIAKKTLIAANKLYPDVKVIRRDWLNSRLPDKSFRVITGFNADNENETPAELKRFLSEMHRILTPGGRMSFLSIASPNTETWGGCKPMGDPGIDYDRSIDAEPTAIARFQEAEGRILRKMGLKPVQHSRDQTFGKYAPIKHVYSVHLEKPQG